jgi:hypothetical protein|tara:strand:- start:118 stop:1518 length:1401 start_codon:yes stop_codon:yes gene_type:complete
MASTYLTKVAPAAGNRTKGTISMWVKRGSLGSTEYLYTEYLNSTDHGVVYFSGANGLNIKSVNGNSAEMQLSTNRKFRDINGWYNLVFAWDTSQVTASDRVKMYVNGVQETSFSTATYPSQSSNLKFGIGSPSGNNYNIYIGRKGSASDYFTGSMSHFHRVDNQQLTPSTFGSTDSTTGEWKINTSPSITYTGSSSHNFFILKDGNSVTDQSGEGNNLTVGGGTLTKTEDCPSNVFATLNPLDQAQINTKPTLASGNTQWTASGNSSSNCSIRGTIGNSSGKFYFEAKLLEASNAGFGMHRINEGNWYDSTGYMGNNGGLNGILFTGTDNIRSIVNGTNNGSSLGTVSNNDIIGCAFDLDNKKFYFHKNGTYISIGGSVGDPTSGSTGTGAFGTLGNGLNSSTALYVPAVWNESYGTASSVAFNFGNGYFGTTAVSSAGTNASNIGIFEYDVPTGYTALSTKGLNL